MEEFKASVIIPFYNAQNYVTQAVESALEQSETGEVLLIEDGSPDGGLRVCEKLAQTYPNVRLMRHPDGGNHGVSASRNLGIRNACFPYIAFLDADDFYLPNRFRRTVEVFNSKNGVDGVYEAINATFEDQAAREFWLSLQMKEIKTVTKYIRPERLFIELMVGKIGFFSPDGLTVHKRLFSLTGLFDERFQIGEDMNMIVKMAAKGNLYPGSIEIPVSTRRVHKGNRVTYHLTDLRRTYENNKKVWEALHEWGKVNLTKDQLLFLSRRYSERLRKVDYLDDLSTAEFVNTRLEMLRLTKNSPRLLLDTWFWRMMIPSKQLIKRNF
jgi:glycosyltransferase involved in cell wall biosynthesis